MAFYKSILASFLVLSSLISYSQTKSIEISKVNDSLKVLNNPDESYQLYLPSNFSSDKEWPVVFIFDPAARGSIGIKPFIKSSETYGYILVCSNNSRNNSYSVNYSIANNLFKDVFNQFPIDTSKVYLAGFSGGSRLSSYIASKNNMITGVVGCGAGLASGIYFNRTSVLNFSYVGIVGDIDMNYTEMLKNKENLGILGVPNTLIIYQGNHTWPPENEILRAFDWLELEYLRKHKIIHKEFIDSIYNKDFSIAENYLQTLQYLYAFDELNKILITYEEYIELDSIHNKMETLERNRTFKKQRKKKKKYESLELRITKEYMHKLSTQLYSRSDTIYTYWSSEAKKIIKLTNGKNIEQSKMAKRIQAKIWIWCYETGIGLKNSENIESLYFTNQIWSFFKPNSVYPFFHMAIYYANVNDYKKSLKYLQIAIENGLQNKNIIENTNEFEPLRNFDEYKQIINSLSN